MGAGIGSGITNTEELHVLKYNEAMQNPDREEWVKAVEKEHQRMIDSRVWKVVQKKDLPENVETITSTWSMKKKANGTCRARMVARGFEQKDGVNYDSTSTSSPVVNEVTIRIVFTLMIMANWASHLLDVKGAFLLGNFEETDEKIYMEVPQGFEKYYDPTKVLLLLLRTTYGLKQAAYTFWKELLKAFRSMGFARSKADPCLYFSWTAKHGLILWISWIDDCVVMGKKEGVEWAQKEMQKRFDCDDVGELVEYLGCKIDRTKDSIHWTQPVMLQSFQDEFELPEGKMPEHPAVPGSILVKDMDGTKNALSPENQKTYKSGVGKLLHMMKWTRPEILNAVRDLSRHMQNAVPAHLNAMYRVMKYCIGTPNRGLELKPNEKWDGNKNFKFKIKGKADSNCAADPETCRSVSGWSVFLCGSPVVFRSKTQVTVKLSTTEAEQDSSVSCVQDMLFVMHVIESLGLQVEKPMIIEIDNKGTVDLANNWSVGGRTRHVEVKKFFLRELKEQGILRIVWVSNKDMSSDIFTKNVGGNDFKQHTKTHCGEN